MQSDGAKVRAFGGSLTKVGVEQLAIAIRPRAHPHTAT
jgi:hypothetical protein